MVSTVTPEFAGLYNKLASTFGDAQDLLTDMYTMGSEGSVYGRQLWWGNMAGQYYDLWEGEGLPRLNNDIEAIHISLTNARTAASNFYAGDNNPEAADSLAAVPTLAPITPLGGERPAMEPVELDETAESNAQTLKTFIEGDVNPTLTTLSTDGVAAMDEVHTGDADQAADHWSVSIVSEIESLQGAISDLLDAVELAISGLRDSGGGYGSRQ